MAKGPKGSGLIAGLPCDEEYTPNTQTNLTLESSSTSNLTGEGEFDSGDTEGTFEISSSSSTYLLLTDKSSVSSKSWTDIEAGKVQEVTVAGETELLMTIHSSSTYDSEFTTQRKSPQNINVTETSSGTMSTATSVDFEITGLETYGGTLTSFEKSGYYIPPPNTITTEGETLTLGEITSSFTYSENGGSSHSSKNSSGTTTSDSDFSISITSDTKINIEAVDTIYSEWSYPDSDEGKVTGFELLVSDSKTNLEYNSDFSFNQDDVTKTSGSYGYGGYSGGTHSSQTESDISVTSDSKVESFHHTHDSHQLQREMVEGKLVKTETSSVTGSFNTEATMTSISDFQVTGTSEWSNNSGYSTNHSDTDFEIDNKTTTTVTAKQSGSYGASGNDSSSSSTSTKTVAETSQKFSSDSASKTMYDGWTQTTDWETSSETTTEFKSSESYSDKDGNSAKWSSSQDYEDSWSTSYYYSDGGWTISDSDSGGNSWSESSGDQTYTPPEEGNPSNHYDDREFKTFGGKENNGDEEENPFNPGSAQQSGKGNFGNYYPRDVNGDGVVNGVDLRLLRAEYLNARKELARLISIYGQYYRYYSKLGVLTPEQQEEWDSVQDYLGWLIGAEIGNVAENRQEVALMETYLEWKKITYRGQPEGIRWESCTRCHALHGFGRGNQNPLMIDDHGFVKPEYEEGVSSFMFYSNGVLVLVGTYFIAGRIIYVFQTQGAAAGTILIVEEAAEQGVEYVTGVPIIVKPTDVAETMLKKGASQSIANAAERAAKAQERAARKAAKETIPKTKTDALKKHVLNGELDAARREAAGEVVARKKDGTPWNHVQELQDAQRGLLKRIQQLKKELGNPALDGATRRRLEAELREASKLLDISEGFLPR